VSAPVIGPLIIASGLVVCSRPASTKPQLATGPQKCVVLGPVGELMNFMSADDIVVVGAAVGRDGAGDCGGATRLRPVVGNPTFCGASVHNSLVSSLVRPAQGWLASVCFRRGETRNSRSTTPRNPDQSV
jgi:hypothetical protein